MNERAANDTKPLVVDLTAGNPVLAQVPDTLLLVEAATHETAKRFVQSDLDPAQLQPGTTNVRRAEESRRWWVFGVFL